jgi:hypothetical protein
MRGGALIRPIAQDVCAIIKVTKVINLADLVVVC